MIRLMQGPLETGDGIRRRPAFDGMVECPVHGHADLEKCTTCAFLVRFEGEDQIVVLCGYGNADPPGPA